MQTPVMNMARCKECENLLNRDGIFPPALDPFYMVVGDRQEKDGCYETAAYHAVLAFFVLQTSDTDETVLEESFIHEECAPPELKNLEPTKTQIQDFLFSGDPGMDIQVGLAIKEAKRTRVPGSKFQHS